MTKKEWQILHGFDDFEMEFIAFIRQSCNAQKITVFNYWKKL